MIQLSALQQLRSESIEQLCCVKNDVVLIFCSLKKS